MPRGTTQVVTRDASNDWCQMCRYEQSVRGRRVPIMCNNEAVGGAQNDQNTPRSSNIIGWRLERMKLPPPT
ncbi:hypothetical protein Tco_0100469 [Tanacetum coccineum]